MSLDQIVNLTITTEATAPTRQGFGIPLLMAYHSRPERLIQFNSDTEAEDAGFAVTSPVYRMVQMAFRQNPRPLYVMLGKRTTAYTQTLEITPVNVTPGFTYSFEGVDPDGVATPIEYVVQNGDTVSAVCAALTALMAPMADSTAVATPAAPNSTHVLVTTTVGKLTNFRNLPNPADLKIKDTSTDPGIVADLSAVESQDARTWYGIAFDHSPRTVISAAAAWIEARRKIGLFNTSDSEALDPAVTNDIASALKAASYVRSEILYSGVELLSYSALAWMSLMLPKTPGSATWAFKSLAGVTVDTLTGGQMTAAKNKNLNTYTALADRGVTLWGQGPNSGYIDIAIGTDWLYARLQEAIFFLLAQSDKVPYTDSGVDSIRNVMSGVFEQGVENGFLTPDYTITFPKVRDVPQADRQGRHLPNGAFQARMQGAIHTVDINGRLTM